MNLHPISASTSSPPLLLKATREPHPTPHLMADRVLGTIRPHAGPHSVPVRCPHSGTAHFHPAWNVQAELDSLTQLSGTDAAQRQLRATLTQAAERRLSCGRTWHPLTLTVRAYNASGELLACLTMQNLPSDSPYLDELEADLTEQVREEALDWAILGLN